MKNKIILILGAIGLLSFSFVPSEAPLTELAPPVYQTENVIILIIDGPRMSETFGDPSHQYIPHLYEDLKPQGVLFTNFKNNGVTTTNSGHTAICTGVYQSVKNNGSELPKQPTIFQYYLKSSAKSKDKAWVLASKGKLNVLANSSHKDWFNSYMPSHYCGPNGNGAEYTGDINTWNKAIEVMDEDQPNLMLINLLEVDTRAHAGQWENYLKAIVKTDDYANRLWLYLQENEHYKGKTTLIITNDHGRHLDDRRTGYREHGDGCDGCRSIYMLGLGPDFDKNKVVTEEYEQIDL
ncbi:MAG: membrane-anchored protein YejM (alkaline phosphatase superfamily), partial [Crocinitomicaceae bacterium]